MHEKAATGFSNGAAAYELGRPGYPAEAVRHVVEALGLTPGSTVLEVGAGTGKFTRLLVDSGANVIAVEPVRAMRDRLCAALPQVEVHDATAESLPLADSSVDGIVVAQAFHWFDGRKALAEFWRVMRPGGTLALVWNARDESTGWVSKITEILKPFETDMPRYHDGTWREAFGDAPFGPIHTKTFSHVHRSTPERVIDRVASISFVAALPVSTRAMVLGEVQALLQSSPDTAGRIAIDFPYETFVYTARALAGSSSSPR